MNNLDSFKLFVKDNPTFVKFIRDGSMTWQKFYELYDMYGEDSNIWDEFKISSKKNSPTLSDIVNMAKNIDINKLQAGVNSLSKAVNLFSELFINKEDGVGYTPRAIYQRLDD